MKRYLLFIVLVVATLCAKATDRFYIQSFTMTPGQTRTVSIFLDNETAFTAFQTDLYLPEGLNTDEDSFDLTERKSSNHTLTVSRFPDGSYRLMSYSIKLKTYSDNSGALVTFDLTASEDFSGPVVITLRNTIFTTEEGEEIAFEDDECTVFLKGDVNIDATVNVSDLTCLIDMLSDDINNASDSPQADINEDGIINIKDLTDLIDLLLAI